MRKDFGRLLYLAGGVFAVCFLVWAFVVHPPGNSGEWASWVQAVGAIAAIAATGIYVHWQHALEIERTEAADLKTRTRTRAAILLSLQSLAAELRRMNILAGLQHDQLGNPIIYPDVVAECGAIALLFTQLPIDQIATMGKMDVYLELRRAANELGMAYATRPVPGDGFYVRNREQLTRLEKRCSDLSLELAREIEELDPELYLENKVKMHRL